MQGRKHRPYNARRTGCGAPTRATCSDMAALLQMCDGAALYRFPILIDEMTTFVGGGGGIHVGPGVVHHTRTATQADVSIGRS